MTFDAMLDGAAPSTTKFPRDDSDSFSGMRISLSGVLVRAAKACKRSRDDKHLEHPLGTLREHIETMRAAKSDAEALAMLDEFLALWVLS